MQVPGIPTFQHFAFPAGYKIILLDINHNFSLYMTCSQVTYGFGRLAHRVRSFTERRHLSRLEKFSQHLEIILIEIRNEEEHLLARAPVQPVLS